MRQTIDKLKANNALRVITEPLDVELEIPHLAYLEVKRKDSKALLFVNPVDKKHGIQYEIPVLMNVFGSFKLVELLVGDVEKQASEVASLIKLKPPRTFKEALALSPKLLNLRFLSPKILKGRGLCQEVIRQGDAVDLGAIPILKTWSEDGGRFITMGQCYTQSLDGSVRNLGMYRLQVYDKNHLGVHWQIHKDSVYLLEEYRKVGQKMPVSIAIGGDPLYTWCATAPLPYGLYELMLYGFIKKQKPKLVRCVSNSLCVPYDADFVIEGFVDPEVMRNEGRFGDHTGFYTPIEPYPVLEVSVITSKKNPVYLATVVGKPPLEDKYLGYPTERIFLPLLQTTTPDLIDYYMPENGVFHNLILAKIKARFPNEAKQSMHAFWGVGQMSFVKHAIFVDENAPKLQDLEIIPYILNRFSPKACLLSDGVCDALDHASPEFAQGGKLGVDCTRDYAKDLESCEVLDNDALKEILANVLKGSGEVKRVLQIYMETKNPIALVGLEKKEAVGKVLVELYKKLESKMDKELDSVQKLQKHARVVVVVDDSKNDLENLYMLLWRVVNNIDAKRDVKILDSVVFIDATDKDIRDGYFREWPKETDCSLGVLKHLEAMGLLKEFGDLKKFYKAFHIDKSYNC
ncbi:menaquinone biosynthesis decarboxylase [Helicobacter turcicus]|uniref:Menaquinone biosynthesis decarboxylase n=1 Tax=Helicobacter turcicus TaxID=2867412 RepID=A0ABS7JPN1_9HELI|nr:menaquinone biosynthesis decarboxylase [Helicobacter turcicus]MBX7491322.1 menaquinone biosynthesis decarboxylase [Helicobacter turcicus]MBX7546191.1 menaquinone biosynthesis decarboxylase [Helicobacter turcicus]